MNQASPTYSEVNSNYQINLAASSDIVHKGMKRCGPDQKETDASKIISNLPFHNSLHRHKVEHSRVLVFLFLFLDIRIDNIKVEDLSSPGSNKSRIRGGQGQKEVLGRGGQEGYERR